MTEPAVEKAVRVIRLLIDEIAKEPKRIRIDTENIGLSVVGLNIYADATDFGKILGGKQAHLAGFNAIAGVIGRLAGRDIRVALIEVPGGVKSMHAPFQIREQWPREKVEQTLQEIFDALLVEPCRVVISDASAGRSVAEVIADSKEQEWLTTSLERQLAALVKAVGLKYGRQLTLTILRDSALLESGLVGGGVDKAHGWSAPDPMDMRGFVKA